MPGLAIILNQHPARENLPLLRRMIQSMQHEEFYSSGEYANEALGLYVAWTCLTGSYSDCMPIESADRNSVLFFYGEHHSDNGSEEHNAEEVIRLFEKHGTGFLELLNGWFHGVLVDLVRREVLVFNDRLGMQRLYQTKVNDGVMFASEAKALLKVNPELRRWDAKGLGELMSCGSVLENRTLFAGIRTLPAGSLLTFEEGRATVVRSYFTPGKWETQSQLSEGQFAEELVESVPRIMRRYFRDPASLAISLTGGFDTRVLMAYLDETQQSPPCYTFGGLYRECFDIKIGRKVAKQCGCPYRVVSLQDDFLSSFPGWAEKTAYISDGNLGVFSAYELYLNKRAREIGRIRLTGSFGSEVMRGARAYKASEPTSDFFEPELEAEMHTAIDTFNRVTRGHDLSFSVFKQAPWFYFNRLAVEQSQVTIRTPFLDNDLVGLMYRRPVEPGSDRNLSLELIRHRNARLARLPTDTGNATPVRAWLMQMLFKADYCYKSGMPQWLERLHYVLGPFQPEKLLRGIHRFAHPRIWLRKELAVYIKEVLLDPRTLQRPYFRRKKVEQMVLSHLKGTENHTDDIERALTLELTSRLLLES